MDERQTVLIVDDAPENIAILGETLAEEYDVIVARSGEEALRLIEMTPPDLVLLDIVMPEMDGLEVCRRLKDEETTRAIPVIFITARIGEQDEQTGLELGAVDYIAKPFSLPIVKARVRTHLELKRHRDALENLSSIDGLTGIPNRRRFDEFFSREWLRAARSGQPISLIMLDIDYFKAYNDTYGHLEGDVCLRRVAQGLKNILRRPSDFVARYGGEEFVVVLPDTDSDGALVIADRLRREIESLCLEHTQSSVSEYVTVSLGVATTVPSGGEDRTELVRQADTTLYKAKGLGRNRVQVYTHESL